MNVMKRRLRAGAELSARLRVARWGHPSFGGGEERAAKAREQREAFEREAPKQNGSVNP